MFDTFSGEAIEQISMSLYPDAPPTSTPNSLALSPDGRTLLVANADNNAVAVVDVSNSARSFVDGFIPTGWYPTGASFQPRRQADLRPERQGARAVAPTWRTRHGEAADRAPSSIVPTPDRTTLADYHAQGATR